MIEWDTKIRDIYLHLQDEPSRQFFQLRLMYSLTRDERFIRQMIESLPQKQSVDIMIKEAEHVKEKLIIYGAGNDFSLLSMLYPDLSCVCLCDCDTNKQKNGWKGYRVISPDELVEDFQEYYVFISTTGFHQEIYDFLTENGWDQEKIFNAGKVTSELYRQQYFDQDIMKPCQNEIFVDGGCYDCSTDRLFVQWCGGEYQKIYAFEPDIVNYERCQKAAKNIQNMNLLNKGLWSREEILHFAGNADQGSKIIESQEQNVTTVPVVAIDEAVGNDKVTFIKMDVEGAELEALKGAKRTILENHPRLAISIYHKPEDIWEIPSYILSLSEEYTFYIRHYQLSRNETILYAI